MPFPYSTLSVTLAVKMISYSTDVCISPNLPVVPRRPLACSEKRVDVTRREIEELVLVSCYSRTFTSDTFSDV